MLILVGPSASGKTEIVKALIKNHQMEKLVTYTTRPKRKGERNGVDYHFISREEFEEKVKNNFFIEHVEYNHNYYGTSRSDLSHNKVVILEPTGLRHYLKAGGDFKVCFLNCPKEIRFKRMIARGDPVLAVEDRLEKDDVIFNDDVKELADWVFDSFGAKSPTIARQIYERYEVKE